MEVYYAGTRTSYVLGKRCAQVLFAGCDFRCVYCYNSSILEPRSDLLVNLSQIKKDVESEDIIAVGGGEPCLQKSALHSLARHAKERGKTFILETNGSRPDVINLLDKEKLVDTILLDIKSPLGEIFQKVTNSRTYFRNTPEIIQGVKETYGILKKSNAKVIVRTTAVPSLMYRKEDFLEMAEIVSSLDARWHLQDFVPGSTLDKRYTSLRPFSKSFLQGLREIIKREYPGLSISV